MHFSIYVLVLVSFLTWLVFVMTAVKIYKFFSEFEKFKNTNDVELNSMVWHLKKLEGDIAEIIVELRRSNKLLYEMRGAGEFPDELHDFHMDSDVFRQDKVSDQKVKKSKGTGMVAGAAEVDVPLKHLPDKTGIESLSEQIIENSKMSTSQPEADVPLKNLPNETEIESLVEPIELNSKDTSPIQSKA